MSRGASGVEQMRCRVACRPGGCVDTEGGGFMRMRSFSVLIGGALLVLTAHTAAAGCGDQPGDLAAVAATRAAADAACPCGTAVNHGQYVSCVADFANNDPSLPKQCKGAVKKCAAKSTCGKPGFVTCCRTKNGKTKCSLKKDASLCTPQKGGSACVGSFSSCCDACTETGCAGGSTTSTAPSTTATTAPSTTVTTTSSTTSTTSSVAGAFIGLRRVFVL